MSLTIRRRSPETKNPIVAVLPWTASSDAAMQIIRAALDEEPGTVLLLARTKSGDVQELEDLQKPKDDEPRYGVQLHERRPGPSQV